MFADAVALGELRKSMLVLDANNHFEGYTNSDGVEFDGGSAKPSLLCFCISLSFASMHTSPPIQPGLASLASAAADGKSVL